MKLKLKIDRGIAVKGYSNLNDFGLYMWDFFSPSEVLDCRAAHLFSHTMVRKGGGEFDSPLLGVIFVWARPPFSSLPRM
jgi:hypothetical protein